jgi:ribonuclease BN (tRNA processing enzyme)
MCSILFLGTAGARVTVFKQIMASGGLWVEASGARILIDPGPGSLVQIAKRKLDPAKLHGIILTHRHLDHSADMNTMIEAMAEGGFRKRGVVLCPADALDDDPVVLRYAREYVQEIRILKAHTDYQFGELKVTSGPRHIHPVECYGLIFHTAAGEVALVADTRYFPGLAQEYRSDYMIVNVVLMEPREGVDHLSIPEAAQLIAAARPRKAIITHFGMTVWRAKPWELAQRLSEETGVPVAAARDGMRFIPGEQRQ